jgi:hypothetical protein
MTSNMSSKYAYVWKVISHDTDFAPYAPVEGSVKMISHLDPNTEESGEPTQPYSTIIFGHNDGITIPLNIQVGDILLISLSLKNQDSPVVDPPLPGVEDNLGQNAITFTSQIKEIKGNSISPYEVTEVNVIPNFGITVKKEDTYYISVDVIGRYNKNKSKITNLKKNINCYSFALNPEEHQPSGTCNFSKIDDIKLVFDDIINATYDNPLTIYALNYNVLRIKNGMGGLAYSN